MVIDSFGRHATTAYLGNRFNLFIMTTLKVPEQKVILCGEYGVGKSSLFRRFTSNTYTTSTDRQSTLGLDHYSKRYHVAGKDIKVCQDFKV